jgi:hypothetical protein
MLVLPFIRRMLSARFSREAMARGPVWVRIWERSSSWVTSRTQCRRFSMAQWPRIQVASSAAVACSVVRLVTAYTTSVVHFLLSSRRVLRMIWMAWWACGNTIPVATVTSLTERFPPCREREWCRCGRAGRLSRAGI